MEGMAAGNLRQRRIERCRSWIAQAKRHKDNKDLSFICWWIAFNALYDYEDESFERGRQRSLQQAFFGKVIDFDGNDRVYRTVLMGFDGFIKALIQNKHVFEPYWEHRNGNPAHADWSSKFARSKRQFNIAKDSQDTSSVLYHVFDRLYTLRNQVVHGGATHGSRRNRNSIEGGRDIMSQLVPVFLDIIVDNPDLDLGRPFYYVDDT